MLERGHVPAPEIVLIYVQHIIEKKKGIGARFSDITPLRCTVDNFRISQWSSELTTFLNGPFSHKNQMKWLRQAVKHVTTKKKPVIFLAKVNSLCAKYWFDEIYQNGNVKATIYVLRNNFGYVGYENNAPFGTILVHIRYKKDNNKPKKRVMVDVDLKKWKQTLSKQEWDGFKHRMGQHMRMN